MFWGGYLTYQQSLWLVDTEQCITRKACISAGSVNIAQNGKIPTMKYMHEGSDKFSYDQCCHNECVEFDLKMTLSKRMH